MADQNKKIRVGVINGSLRKASNNAGLARLVASLAPENVEVVLIRIDELPLVNEDLEVYSEDGKTITLPAPIANIRELVRTIDVLLLSNPQNNGYFSTPLKNAYDWISRDYSKNGGTDTPPLRNIKKVGIVGTTFHSDKANVDLKSLFEGRKIEVFGDLFHVKIGQNFDNQGNLTNEQDISKLKQWSNSFYKWIS